MPTRKSSEIADHSELVAELAQVEKLTTAERLKHARKRRQQQLKKFSLYEKQLEKEQSKKSKKSSTTASTSTNAAGKRSKGLNVKFINNIRLLEAASRNDLEEVKALLDSGVNPDVTNEDGLTALHQCCIDDLQDMLQLLLKFGANINSRDSELWSPLHAAATCGHTHLCEILIKNGAQLLAVNADGNMPYDICEDEATLDFIENEMANRGITQEQIDQTRLSTEQNMLSDLKALADKGGDLEYLGRHGETPLHIASANGYEQVAEFLLSQQVSIDVEDDDGWHPIHAAACWGHLPILELLVQHGADLEAKTRSGETPFDICEDVEMRDRLMELKVEMETKGIVKSRHLVRRRSTNTRSSSGSLNRSGFIRSSMTMRSASVRRSSMREKAAISWKEALEEGQRLRTTLEDRDDPEGIPPPSQFQNGPPHPSSSEVKDVHADPADTKRVRSGSMADSEASDGSNKRSIFKGVFKGSSKKRSSRELQESPQQSSGASAIHATDATPKTNPSPKVSPKVSPKTSPETSQESNPKPSPQKPAEKQETNNLAKQVGKRQAPITPSDRRSLGVDGRQSVALDGQVNGGGNGRPMSEVQRRGAGEVKQTPSVDTDDHIDDGSDEMMSTHTSVPNPATTFESSSSASTTSSNNHPMTLSELKRRRSEQFQKKLEESLRHRDMTNLNAEIQAYNADFNQGHTVVFNNNKNNGKAVYREPEQYETTDEKDPKCCVLQ